MDPTTEDPRSTANTRRRAREFLRDLPLRVLEFLDAVPRWPSIRLDLARAGYTQADHAFAWEALLELGAWRTETTPPADLEGLCAWWVRWSETARAVVSRRSDLVRLGLRKRHASRAARLPSARRKGARP